MSYRCRLITEARILLEHGEPLPVDLEAKLMEEGVDVPALKDNHEI